MAHTDFIPENVETKIAEKIGSFLPDLVPQLAGMKTLEMSESMTVWMMPADKVSGAVADRSRVADVVTPTNSWHHQIKADGRATSFARSIPGGVDPSSWMIAEVFESSLAQGVNDCVELVEREMNDEWLVRLLTIPAYWLHALWLTKDNEEKILIAEIPETCTHLEKERFYNAGEFFESLAKEPPTIGLQL